MLRLSTRWPALTHLVAVLGAVALISACGGNGMTGQQAPLDGTSSRATVRHASAHVSSCTQPIVGNAIAECTWYNGTLYAFHISSVNSQSNNELLAGCYNLGPLSKSASTGSSSTLYALSVTGASMHECANGQRVHDHLIDAVLGTSGYYPLFKLIHVVNGPNPDPSILPIKSVAALEAAASAGNVAILPWDGTTVKASVVGIPIRARTVAAGDLAPSSTVTVSIVNYSYFPATITIKAGTTIKFVNHDVVEHTVTAKSGAFTSPLIGSGVSWKHTFKKAGITVHYYCQVHPSMTGIVKVTK